MKIRDYLNMVPQQTTGKDIDTEATANCHSIAEAQAFYSTVRQRLLAVNNWHKVAGWVSGHFQLVADGHEVNRPAQQGDYIRIDIPGPGSQEGDGYDWVRIEQLQEGEGDDWQCIGFRVRPSANPLNDHIDIAHFYDAEGTSSFIVTRVGSMVTASVIDRNLKPNDETESVVDKIRHVAVGLGALGSFSKLQWQNLTQGLVATDK